MVTGTTNCVSTRWHKWHNLPVLDGDSEHVLFNPLLGITSPSIQTYQWYPRVPGMTRGLIHPCDFVTSAGAKGQTGSSQPWFIAGLGLNWEENCCHQDGSPVQNVAYSPHSMINQSFSATPMVQTFAVAGSPIPIQSANEVLCLCPNGLMTNDRDRSRKRRLCLRGVSHLEIHGACRGRWLKCFGLTNPNSCSEISFNLFQSSWPQIDPRY